MQWLDLVETCLNIVRLEVGALVGSKFRFISLSSSHSPYKCNADEVYCSSTTTIHLSQIEKKVHVLELAFQDF
eukprot:scaffold16240_cov116-Skeletonema_dohrnii-CCMP3373.AAC.7